MNPVLIGVIGLAVLFVLMALEVPIAFAMALVGFCGFAVISGLGAAVSMVGLVPYTTAADYIFSVLPLFLLMGEFASVSGLMQDAYRAINKWLGHLPGGLAMATIGGCAAFAAVCGSSVATAATMTRVALPEMRKFNYDPSLATGSLAAGGTLGIMIPPSMQFILYGVIAEQSIGKLFMAGILPGLLLSSMLMLAIYTSAKMNPSLGPVAPKARWRERFASFKEVWGVILLFVIVMGGIWGGFVTPTEAAAVGSFVSFLIILLRRQLNRQNLIAAFLGAFKTTGMCLGILIGAMIFGYFIAVTTLPMALAKFVSALPVPPIGILICMLAVYLVLGCLMDALAMILLTMPIFIPVILALGFDPIWFGVILTLMCELALITPPIGMNVFVISGMADIPMYTVFRGVMPFVITMAVGVAILIAFPQISLFLPKTMMAMK
jgi:tripartite ATP-independent transporter DctM subunit